MRTEEARLVPCKGMGYLPSGRRVFAAFIRTGSPVGLMSCGDWLGEGIGGEGAVGAVTCWDAAARFIEEGGREQTKGSVLMDGGGIAS